MRRTVIALAGALVMLGSSAAAASASTNPFAPPAGAAYPASGTPLVQPGANPSPLYDIACGSGSCSPFWVPNSNYGWFYSSDSVPPQIFNSTGDNLIEITGLGSGWQQFYDVATGLCITWNGGPNLLYEKPCAPGYPNTGYKASEEWASSPAGDGGYTYYSWNLYVKQKYPTDCGNTYAPVISASIAGAPLRLTCPEGSPTTYTTNQAWLWEGP